MILFLFFCVIGRVILYVIQKFPWVKLPFIGQKLWGEGKFLEELFGCDLCLGVWIYSALAFAFKMNMLWEIGYVPVLYEIITGMVTSFLVHLIRLGWEAKFQVVWVKE